MTLTPDDLKILKRAFSRADHEFINGYVYLTEEAVSNRIDEVDPAWAFEIQRLAREGDQTVCCVRMTIKGVSREGVGMYRQTNPNGEPEKSAATDAIKRCARLFGVGRYLLDAPKTSGDNTVKFDEWLAQQQKALNNGLQAPPASKPQPPPSVQPDRPSVSQTGTPAPNGSASSTGTSQQANGGSPDEPLFPPVKRYLCTAVRVVPFGRGKQVQMRRKDGGDPIVLLGREKLVAAGYSDSEVDTWVKTLNEWMPLVPEAEVEAAFTNEAWEVGVIRQLESVGAK